MFHSIFVSFSIWCFKCIICIHILYISKVTLHLSTYTCKVNKGYMTKYLPIRLHLEMENVIFFYSLPIPGLEFCWNLESFTQLIYIFGENLHLSLLVFNINKSNIHVWHWCKYKVSKIINWVNLYIGFRKFPKSSKTCKSCTKCFFIHTIM